LVELGRLSSRLIYFLLSSQAAVFLYEVTAYLFWIKLMEVAWY
jgi:hypothetical protein